MELIVSKKQRQLSGFLCREMFFDYIKGNLDKERSLAVEVALSLDEDLREDFRKLKKALQYTENLSRATLEESALEKLRDRPSQLKWWLEEGMLKNTSSDWRWVFRSLVLAFLILGATLVIPWRSWLQKIPQDASFSLRDLEGRFQDEEVDESPHLSLLVQQDSASLDLRESSSSEDQENRLAFSSDESSPTMGEGEAPSFPQDSETLLAKTLVESSPLPSRSSSNQEIKEDKESFVEGDALKVSKALPIPKKPRVVSKKEAFKGVLYRASIKLGQIEKTTEEFREKILGLGGEKAGEVEIGWRKPDGSYFHFSMEESSLEDFKLFMSSYGSVKFSKVPHWRVMPEGKIRMILWIEDRDFK